MQTPHGAARATATLARMTPHDYCSTAASAERDWRRLVRRLGSRHGSGADLPAHSVWLRFAWPEQQASRLVEVTDAVQPPTGAQVDSLAGFLTELERQLAPSDRDDELPVPACRLAVLRTRPGGGAPDAADLAWTSALVEAAERAGLTCVLACFGSRDDFRTLSPGTVVRPVARSA